MKYRPEIDGLRSVAVLPVILFHAGLGLFPGGYVGVDVLFVISGILTTTIMHFRCALWNLQLTSDCFVRMTMSANSASFDDRFGWWLHREFMVIGVPLAQQWGSCATSTAHRAVGHTGFLFKAGGVSREVVPVVRAVRHLSREATVSHDAASNTTGLDYGLL